MDAEHLVVGFGAAQRAHLANLSGLSQEEATRTLGLEGNSVNWIAGHLLSGRDRLQARLGGKAFLDRAEADLYRTGTSPRSPGRSPVPIDRILEGLRQTGPELLERFRRLTCAQLETPVDPATLRFPVERPVLGDQLAFFVFHEGYHSGQLGIARRILGKPSGLGF